MRSRKNKGLSPNEINRKKLLDVRAQNKSIDAAVAREMQHRAPGYRSYGEFLVELRGEQRSL